MKIYNLETHRYADIFPMTEGNSFENLKKDILEQGLQQTIILYEGKILDGRNRFKACKELGLEPRFEVYNGDKPLQYVISGNLHRRHLTDSQKAVIAQEVMPILEEEARKRQLRTSENRTLVVEKVPQQNKYDNKSSVQASKIFQVNERYIRQVKKLKEDGREDIIEQLKSGTKNLSEVKKEDRLEKIEKQREEIKKEVIEKPTGLFNVVVIDPPWNYQEDKLYDPEGFRGLVDYPTMSIEEIKNINLPIEEDCVIWLWTTNTHIFDCKNILNNWGFEVKTILTWNKVNIGMGRWLRSQTEHCILAIKGKPFFNNTKWSTLITETRTTHSKKPDLFYKMVDEICEGRKLDYFARNKRDGWVVYGDEIKGD